MSLSWPNLMNCKSAAGNGTITALIIVIYSAIGFGYWLDHFLSLSLHETSPDRYLTDLHTMHTYSFKWYDKFNWREEFRHHLVFIFCTTLNYSRISSLFCRLLPLPRSDCAQSNYSLCSLVFYSLPLSLIGHQFYYHHLLCCISIWRLLRSGHLWDDLCHGLLRYLHDGYGQAVHNGQLDVECECSVWLTARFYTLILCIAHSCTMLHVLLPSCCRIFSVLVLGLSFTSSLLWSVWLEELGTVHVLQAGWVNRVWLSLNSKVSMWEFGCYDNHKTLSKK